MKRGKKALAVLSTAALLGTTPTAVALPFLTSGVAYAAGSATALVTPTISSSAQSADLGTIDLVIPKGALKSGTENQVTLMLPSGFQFDKAVIGTSWRNPQVGNSGTVTWAGSTTAPTLTSVTDPNGNPLYPYGVPAISDHPVVSINGKVPIPYIDMAVNTSDTGSVKWEILSSNLMKITVENNPAPSQSDDWHLLVHLPQINVNGPGNGPVNVTLTAPSTSALPTGSVTVANVATSGQVDLAATDVQSGSDSFEFNLAVNEEVAGSLKPGTSVKLKLPSGFVWDNPVATANTIQVFGDSNYPNGPFTVQSDGGQSLWLQVDSGAATGKASGYLITHLKFHVDDETVAKQGDVTVQVTGSSVTNVSSLVVGHYGQIGFTVSAGSQPTLIAGQKEQVIGDIVIKENTPGSFVSGRTVTLTLPDGARWEAPFENSNNATSSGGSASYVGSLSATNGLGTPTVTYTDSDRRTLKLTVNGQSNASSTNPAEIDLRNFQVALQPGFTGDLTIQVGGTEGVTGNVTVASVQTPVSISVDNAPNVIIGSGGQALGTITLKENIAGGFAKNADVGSGYNLVHLELPYGVQFDGTPTVQVTQGDLQIKDVSSGLGTDNKGYLNFYVDAESTTPSVITITNAKLKLDRTVPEGDITLKVKGPSVAYTANALDAKDDKSPAVPTWHDNNTTAASAVVAHVTTPAQSGSNVATFTVGSTTYTVNGQQQTMDVAPYLKNDGRVMLPVRFVANALGVSDDSIIWNQNDKSVTIFKGGSVVKMTLGSNTLIVNGTAVQMDVAPELYNDGRVMLPIRWVGQALNANISWDQATQTVTVTTQQ